LVRQHELGDNVVICLARQMVPQPSLVMLPKGDIRFRGVDDLGARIDPRLNGIGLDQRQCEAMDRASDELVK
jgi:hypothetical protein